LNAIQAVLEARARTYARPLTVAHDDGKLEMLRFSAGDEPYAIATAFVLRIMPLMRISRLPHVPPHFAGLASLRGEVFAVIDVRRLLGSDATEHATHLIILGRTHPDIALLADSIDGIDAMSPDAPGALDGAALLDDPRLVVGARPARTAPVEETQT
jgi:chemotaxis signal transduction protein